MTEAEWLACEIPEELYAVVYPFPDRHPGWSDRKDRLLGCACARRMASLLTPDELWCLDALEAYADETVTDLTLDHARETIIRSYTGNSSRRMAPVRAVSFLTDKYVSHLSDFLIDAAIGMAGARCANGQEYRDHFDNYLIEEQAATAYLVREVAGNPFRPVAPEPSWLTSDVLALARGIYEEKAFDRMPILADALQDAGCANEDVLTHCRDANATHVRGCWALDLVLGKV